MVKKYWKLEIGNYLAPGACILAFAVFLPLWVLSVNASELKGFISTDPGRLPGLSGPPPLAEPALWRGSRGRIYLVKGRHKRIVRNLAALRAFAGWPIAEKGDETLSRYPDRPYLDGELVRERGTAAVYAVEGGGLRRVPDLAELRRDFFGLPIHNAEKSILAVFGL